MHIGPVAIPAGLAAAELVGGCSGKEFLASLTLGIELASRLNLMNFESTYYGFDPTGVCAIYAGTATAGSVFTATSGTLNWADGEVGIKSFTVTLTDDGSTEGRETIMLQLSGVSGAVIGTTDSKIFLYDND